MPPPCDVPTVVYRHCLKWASFPGILLAALGLLCLLQVKRQEGELESCRKEKAAVPCPRLPPPFISSRPAPTWLRSRTSSSRAAISRLRSAAAARRSCSSSSVSSSSSSSSKSSSSESSSSPESSSSDSYSSDSSYRKGQGQDAAARPSDRFPLASLSTASEATLRTAASSSSPSEKLTASLSSSSSPSSSSSSCGSVKNHEQGGDASATQVRRSRAVRLASSKKFQPPSSRKPS